jgi:3-hydroxyisobutyrate dehydrogenase-like beta-hydroxyacid dehydrogenase
MQIAVLGAGTMGEPIAENLARAGHYVVVWNRTCRERRGKVSRR